MVQARNKTDFIPSDEFIARCISRLPPPPNPSTFPVALLPDQRVGDPFGDDWICLICTNVVWQARQCGECEKLVCAKCIDDWLIRSPTCPACRQDFKSVKVARAYNSYLEASNLKCRGSGCNRTFRYLDAAAHLADDAAPSHLCVLNCGDPDSFSLD